MDIKNLVANAQAKALDTIQLFKTGPKRILKQNEREAKRRKISVAQVEYEQACEKNQAEVTQIVNDLEDALGYLGWMIDVRIQRTPKGDFPIMNVVPMPYQEHQLFLKQKKADANATGGEDEAIKKLQERAEEHEQANSEETEEKRPEPIPESCTTKSGIII